MSVFRLTPTLDPLRLSGYTMWFDLKMVSLILVFSIDLVDAKLKVILFGIYLINALDGTIYSYVSC